MLIGGPRVSAHALWGCAGGDVAWSRSEVSGLHHHSLWQLWIHPVILCRGDVSQLFFGCSTSCFLYISIFMSQSAGSFSDISRCKAAKFCVFTPTFLSQVTSNPVSLYLVWCTTFIFFFSSKSQRYHVQGWVVYWYTDPVGSCCCTNVGIALCYDSPRCTWWKPVDITVHHFCSSVT